MAEKRKRFTIPNSDEVDDENTSKRISKSAFSLYQKNKEVDKAETAGTSSKDATHLKQNSDFEARRRLLKALEARNSKLPSSLLEKQPINSEADVSGSGIRSSSASESASTSGLSSVEAGSERMVSGPATTEEAVTVDGRPPILAKSFKDTFAFLKETKHYEEAAAQMKVIESTKPASEKVSIPTKPKPNAILVNPRQKGNPVLKSIRCVPWEYADIIPDYVLGATTCALFLSIRYHHFNPDYVHDRLAQLGPRYELRILLVLVDVKDPHHTIKELTKMAIMADCTIILAWSSEEAGRYLETYKVYENKPVDALQGQSEGDYMTKLQDCLTTVKGVNKTDVITLNSTFGSLAEIAKTPKDDLAFLPGFGPLKAKRLHGIFHEPFLKKKKGADSSSQELQT